MKRPIHIGPAMEIIHPEYGDMTAEVAHELQLLEQENDARVVREAAARQAHIAKSCNQEARIIKGERGDMRLIASIDETIYNYWALREGPEFWTKRGDLNYMLKRHPELAVKAINPNKTFGYEGKPAHGVSSKRGRGRWSA